MIFYFSGTGNSQLVAKQIAALNKDEIVSINQSLKNGLNNTYHSEAPLVFITPTYAWRIPLVVTQWIKKNHFEGNHNAYFILTCGDGCGNAAAYAEKLCKENNFYFQGLSSLLMPENYLALFPTPDQNECQNLIGKSTAQIPELVSHIQNGTPFPKSPTSFLGKLLSGPVNLLFYPLIIHDKKFTVSSACISCGKCAQRCPLNNIDIFEKRPVWKGNCTHCMACIGGCPTEAIEYGTKSKGRHRHYVMED